jgi:hypothetical protein
MKVTGFRNLLPLVTKLFSTPVLCAGGFIVGLGSLFRRWWTPYAIRSRCGAPSRHGLQRQSGLAWRPSRGRRHVAGVWYTTQPSLRCIRPLSPLCLPGRRKAQPSTTRRGREGDKRSPWFQPYLRSRCFQRQDCMDKGGFPALLTQRPHTLMSCPFNAAYVCNASSTNIGAIPFR